MFKKTLVLIVLFLGLTTTFAQNGQKAIQLLDVVSTKMNTYKSLYIEFKNNLDNNSEDVHQTTKGNASLKGDLYSVNFLGATTIFDGKKIHTIISEDEEVNISEPNDEDDITPAKFFSFYKDGYNYKWDIEQNVNGRKIQYIKLIPIDSDSELKYVLLGIDMNTKHIYKLIQTGKNGTDITLTITKFKTNIDLASKIFEFNRQKYGDDGYIINDL
jgi:outer membrane lipoprotein-sorting protein